LSTSKGEKLTMADSTYEEGKHARRRLRGRQRKLRNRFMTDIHQLGAIDRWTVLSRDFAETLSQEVMIESSWINADHYLLALYNIFVALGFEMFAGPFPRVSGVHTDYTTPLLAFHPSRAVLLNGHARTLFADIADIQPVCPVPILGLVYSNTVALPTRKVWGSDYVAKWLQEGRRIAGALAIGHLSLSYADLKETLILNPSKEGDQLRKIAARMGILSFLQPPIDALPIFGQHASANVGAAYGLDAFLSEARVTAATGAELTMGDVTQAAPIEAINEPERFLRELRKAKLLDTAKTKAMAATHEGWAYLRSRVLPFPLGQLLHHTTLAARQEIRAILPSVFADALRQGTGLLPRTDSSPALITIDDIDSFSSVALIAPDSVVQSVPVSTSEFNIKATICRAVGDTFKKDWGGEQNDIFTTRVVIDGRRIPTAFLLKGPAVKGRLTIAKCGKNGDQIQRLFESAAELFVIQFNGEIDERVVAEARQKTFLLRSMGFASARCAIVDGLDTARLLAAYRPEGN
jgi:hypothetical protein